MVIKSGADLELLDLVLIVGITKLVKNKKRNPIFLLGNKIFIL